MTVPQKTRTEIRIFIASPGGLEVERKIAFDAVTRVNKTLSRQLNIYVDIFGWEHVLSGFDRPQSIINKELEKCNFFIGLIWNKWGTPSGKASSGFLEEVKMATKMLKSGQMREGWLFFKQLSAESKNDPGPEAKQVINFQNKIKKGRTFLYKTFATPEEWEKNLYDDLITYLTTNYLTQPVDTEIGTQTKKQVDEGVTSLGAEASLTKISTSISVGQYEDITEFQLARAKLALEAISFSRFNAAKPIYLETKILNDLYENTANPDLSPEEKFILLLTLIADNDNLKMGWIWLPSEETKLLENLNGIANFSYPIEFRIKALTLLHSLDIKLFRHVVQKLYLLGIADLNEGIFQIIAADPKLEDEAWLTSNLKSGPYDKKTCWDALFKLLRSIRPEASIQLLIDTPEKERGYIGDMTEVFERVDDSFAKALLHDSDLKISLPAFSKLKNSFSEKELFHFVTKGLGILAVESIIELCNRKITVPESLIDGIYSQPVEKKRSLNSFASFSYGPFWQTDFIYVPKQDLVRLAVYSQKDRAALESKIDWSTVGALHYVALISQHYQEFKEQFLEDIANRFHRFKEQEIEEIKTKYKNQSDWLERAEDAKGFLRGYFLKYSLPVLEENFELNNLPLVKHLYLNPDSGSYTNEVTELTLRILRKYGTSGDIPLIKSRLNSFENSSLKLFAMYTILDLELESKAEFVIECLKSNETLIVRELLNYSISANITLPLDSLFNLLYSDLETIRVYVLGYIVAMYPTVSVGDLIPRYRMWTDDYQFYYYNVVCWLDRLMFAPDSLKSFYKAYLINNLKGDSDSMFA